MIRLTSRLNWSVDRFVETRGLKSLFNDKLNERAVFVLSAVAFIIYCCSFLNEPSTVILKLFTSLFQTAQKYPLFRVMKVYCKQCFNVSEQAWNLYVGWNDREHRLVSTPPSQASLVWFTETSPEIDGGGGGGTGSEECEWENFLIV